MTRQEKEATRLLEVWQENSDEEGDGFRALFPLRAGPAGINLFSRFIIGYEKKGYIRKAIDIFLK